MKALYLAAGDGNRIRSIHEGPKCLIQSNQVAATILDYQIEALFLAGITEIGIVVGYEMHQIKAHIRQRYRTCPHHFSFIENASFAHTDSAYSLHQARDWVGGESFVCLNGDVAFDARMLPAALASSAPATTIVDPQWHNGAAKVVIANEGVVRIDREIREAEFSGSHLGIIAFAAAMHGPLFAKTRALIEAGYVHEPFDTAVQQLADEGHRIGYSLTHGLPWTDIDDPTDLLLARRQVFPLLETEPAAA